MTGVGASSCGWLSRVAREPLTALLMANATLADTSSTLSKGSSQRPPRSMTRARADDRDISAGRSTGDEGRRLELVEEEVHKRKASVQTGVVRIRTGGRYRHPHDSGARAARRGHH